MTAIKKNFQEIIDLLESNKDSKVSALMPQLIELCSSKVKSETLKYDEAGNLTHVFCWYHKEWEDINEIEYGKKANTKSGLNTMCKLGVREWTKKQSDAKKAKELLLEQVASGEFVGNVKEALDEIEAQRVS